MGSRTIERVVTAHKQLEGGGFVVRRPFPTGGLGLVDPFLLLDEMGPADYGPGEAVGAPDHPHRGFETVTYMLDGEFEHEDSAGHRGFLAPGDVQWMTAGRGVVHSEMPSRRIREQGGRVHGFQVWVNLPSREKMMPPRYQEVPAAGIPEGTAPDGLVARAGHRRRGPGRPRRDRHANADPVPGLEPEAGRLRGPARPRRVERVRVRVRRTRGGRTRRARAPSRDSWACSGRATTCGSPCPPGRPRAPGCCCWAASRSASRWRATGPSS